MYVYIYIIKIANYSNYKVKSNWETYKEYRTKLINIKMKVKTTPITQSQRVECRFWKLSIGDIPIFKIVALSRLLFDLRVNDT